MEDKNARAVRLVNQMKAPLNQELEALTQFLAFLDAKETAWDERRIKVRVGSRGQPLERR